MSHRSRGFDASIVRRDSALFPMQASLVEEFRVRPRPAFVHLRGCLPRVEETNGRQLDVGPEGAGTTEWTAASDCDEDTWYGVSFVRTSKSGCSVAWLLEFGTDPVCCTRSVFSRAEGPWAEG